jgi:hypothetical protein
MRHLRQVVPVLALMLVASTVASAQRTTRASAQRSQPRVWEIGADAALSFGLDDPRTTQLQIPIANLRAGIHTSDVISIEPFFGLNYTKVEGFDAVTIYEFGVGGLYHFSPVRTRSQMYVRPFLSLIGISAAGNSDSEVGVGVGFGMKWPKLGGRMAWRGEGNIFSVNDQTSLNALFGISFFTR